MSYCIFTDLRNYDVKNAKESLGQLHDIYVDDQTWSIKWIVIETGSWFSSNKILLKHQHITKVSPSDRTLHVSVSKEEIENAARVDEHPPVCDQRQGEFRYTAFEHDTLLFPGYAGLMMPQTLIERHMPLADDQRADAQDNTQSNTRSNGENNEGKEAAVDASTGADSSGLDGSESNKARADGGSSDSTRNDRHLRSAAEIVGYTVSANDGSLGPLSDLVINPEKWTIDLLALDTSKWLPDRTVVVAPKAIEQISWEDRKVLVKMNKEAIENSPCLHDLKSVETSYLSMLDDYYRFPMMY